MKPLEFKIRNNDLLQFDHVKQSALKIRLNAFLTQIFAWTTACNSFRSFSSYNLQAHVPPVPKLEV